MFPSDVPGQVLWSRAVLLSPFSPPILSQVASFTRKFTSFGPHLSITVRKLSLLYLVLPTRSVSLYTDSLTLKTLKVLHIYFLFN